MGRETSNPLQNYNATMGLPVPGYILQTCWPAMMKRLGKDPKAHQRYLNILLMAASMFWAVKSLSNVPSTLFYKLSATVRISRWDPLNHALDKWFAEHVSSKSLPRHWKAKSDRHTVKLEDQILQVDANHIGQPLRTISYVEDDSFYFWYERRPFRCSTVYKPGQMEVDDEGEKIIWTLGSSKKPIELFLEDVWTTYCSDLRNKMTTIWTPRRGYWSVLADKQARSLDTVDLPDVDKMRLVEDIKNYFLPTTRARYQALGVPFRRGYLFHGPPGTGKTSLCMAIAACFGLELSVLPLANSDITDSNLINYFRNMPQPGILLLEDVDSAGIQRETGSDGPPLSDTTKKVRKYGVTLSGLLNALDGPASPEGTIVIMTTNKPEKLDPALIRASRVDIRIPFTNLDQDLTLKIFRRFIYKDTIQNYDTLANQFASYIPEGKFSPAELQGYLLIHGQSIHSALKNVENWVSEMLATKEKLAERKTTSPAAIVSAPEVMWDGTTSSQPEIARDSIVQSETSADTACMTPSSSTGDFVSFGDIVSSR